MNSKVNNFAKGFRISVQHARIVWCTELPNAFPNYTLPYCSYQK